MIYANPGSEGSIFSFKAKYDNYIGGEWVAPVKGEYFTNTTSVDGSDICQIARSTAEDIELALDAAHAARDAWGRTSVTERSNMLLKIADRIEENLEILAVAETWDNGKAIRETLNADVPYVWTTSVIMQVVFVLKKAICLKLTKTQWLIISMNLWV